MRRIAALALVLACGKAVPSRLPAEGDALILQRVLDGTLAPGDGFSQVALSSGWPITTSKGYLFALADAGNGPYQVSSAAFAAVTLRSEAGVAWALVPIASPQNALYQFATRSGVTFADPLSRNFKYDGSSQVSLVAAAGAHLERWPGIGDANIAPRTLRIWVPEQAATHFLYAHDGQNLFGGVPSSFGGWQLQAGAGPTTLIAGIDNSPARFAEYTPVTDVIGGQTAGGNGDAYTDYLENTVRPFVEAHYGKPVRSGVIGSSLGGVISYHQFLRHPSTW